MFPMSMTTRVRDVKPLTVNSNARFLLLPSRLDALYVATLKTQPHLCHTHQGI